MFQEFELLEYLTVLDNILLPYRITRALRLTNEVIERATQLAEQLGVADQLSRLPQRLSQGEKQRVAICRALVTSPRLLLADEPTGNLDPANKNRVLELMLRSAAEHNITVMMVTHDLQTIIERVERIICVQTEVIPLLPDKVCEHFALGLYHRPLIEEES